MAKNRLFYGLVAAVLVLFIYLREDPMTYLALYAVLIAPLLSFLLTVATRIQLEEREGRYFLLFERNITVTEALDANYIAKGQRTQYSCTVKNRSILPCTSIRLRFEAEGTGLTLGTSETYITVPSKDKHTVRFEISADYRGNYKVGVQNIRLYDFLGLFKFQQKREKSLVFTVVPRIRNIGYLPLDSTVHEGVAVRNHLQTEAYSVVSDLKKYQPSDSLKKIHWKATAKRNELISKNYQETERLSAIFLMDNSTIQASPREALEQEDLMMEILVSAMAHLNQLGYIVSLRFLGSRGTDFTDSFDHLYKAAASLPFGDFGSFEDYLSHTTPPQGDSLSLILFVQEVTEKVFTTLQSFRLFGSNIILFYFPQRAEKEKIERLQGLGIHCIDFREI